MASETLVVRGRFTGGAFIPDGPLPDVEGAAELVITPPALEKDHSVGVSLGDGHLVPAAEEVAGQTSTQEPPRRSVWDAIGKMSPGRTAEDIFEQMREERDSWGDR